MSTSEDNEEQRVESAGRVGRGNGGVLFNSERNDRGRRDGDGSVHNSDSDDRTSDGSDGDGLRDDDEGLFDGEGSGDHDDGRDSDGDGVDGSRVERGLSGESLGQVVSVSGGDSSDDVVVSFGVDDVDDLDDEDGGERVEDGFEFLVHLERGVLGENGRRKKEERTSFEFIPFPKRPGYLASTCMTRHLPSFLSQCDGGVVASETSRPSSVVDRCCSITFPLDALKSHHITHRVPIPLLTA